MSESQTSVTSEAASRTYRTACLEEASIFINKLKELPASAENVLLLIGGQHPVEQFGRVPLSVIAQLAAEKGDDELSSAVKQASDVARQDIAFFYGEPEVKWMGLNRKVLASILDERLFYTSEDQCWTAPLGPIPAEGRTLSTPKPDIGVGLRVMSKADLNQAMRSTDTYDTVLSTTALDDLYVNSETRLVANPSPGLIRMAFPFLVYEAKPDSSPLFYAENQAAGGAAKCLTLQRQIWHSTMRSSPLSFAICSEGTTWEILLCFFDERGEEYHLTRIGRKLDIEDDLDNLQLQLMIGRIRTWALQTYRPAIIDALTALSPAHLSLLRRPT